MMSEIPQSSINDSVIIENGNVLTSSRSVAYVFHKDHRHVLDTIKTVRKEASLLVGNPLYDQIKFYDTTYVHPQNHQRYRKVLMNRRAFLNVVMTFRGPKVFKFRNMYFQAFDNMEKQLEHPKLNKLDQRNKRLLQDRVDSLEPALHQEKHLNWYEEQTVKALKPASDAYHQEMASPYVHPLSNLAERYGTDATHMNLVLQKIGLIGKKGGRWYLTKRFRDYPYASHDLTYEGEHGSGTNSGALKWTQQGFQVIRKLLKLYYNVTELHQNGNDFNMKFLMYQENHKYKITEVGYDQLEQLNLIQRKDNK